VIALDGGKDGLDFYRIIAKEAPGHLLPGGHLLLEIGYDQGESVPVLLREVGFRDIEVIKDLAGNDRVVVALRA
jgi:release factor glutamine methyltransferase